MNPAMIELKLLSNTFRLTMTHRDPPFLLRHVWNPNLKIKAEVEELEKKLFYSVRSLVLLL